jgi:hypothetical protein
MTRDILQERHRTMNTNGCVQLDSCGFSFRDKAWQLVGILRFHALPRVCLQKQTPVSLRSLASNEPDDQLDSTTGTELSI